MLAGGTLGNLLDRVRFGRVTDFVEFGFWPAFNFADVFVVSGVVLLTLMLLARDKREPVTQLLDPLEAR